MSARPLRNIDLDTALADAERRYADANPGSREAFEAACKALPGGNTRSGLYFPAFRLALARGEAAWVWDVDRPRQIVDTAAH